MLDIYSLNQRLEKVERRTIDYSSNVEPKSGQFMGQRWYDESTEVLNVWNGKEFNPAYGNSIIQDIEGNKTIIEQNTTDISLRVEKTKVIAEINLSSEGVRIQGDNIEINGSTTFAAGYAPLDIYSDVFADLGALAEYDVIGVAQMDNTIIVGGYIKTSLINASVIFVGDLNGDLDDISDGSTYKRVNSSEKTGAGRAYSALNSNNRYKNWLDADDMTVGSNPTNGVLFDLNGIRGYGAGVQTFRLDANDGSAYFKGDIIAEGGYINGLLEFNASSGALQSSDYNISTGYTKGWRIDEDGFYVGQGKNISLYYDASIYATHHGYGIIIDNSGIEFIAYLGSDCGALTWGVFNSIEVVGTTIDIDSITATENFAVEKVFLAKGAIVAEGNIILNESSDIYLTSSSNRIYATNSSGSVIGSIRYSGGRWRITDENNGSFDLAP